MGIIILLIPGVCFAEEQIHAESKGVNLWNGTFSSDLSSLTIHQNGTEISGLYIPKDDALSDPGVLEGTLSEDEKTFSGKWTETGPFRLVMDDDAMTYNGTIGISLNGEIINPETSTTNGTRKGSSFNPENLWSGTWNNPHMLNTWVQDGFTVTGLYSPMENVNDEPGVMEGTVSDDGNIFSGTWKESGNFTFHLSDDGSYFNGTYSVSLDPDAKTDLWNGIKIN